jgi:hypothetical protein
LLDARIVNTRPTTDGNRVELFALPAAIYSDRQNVRATFHARVAVGARRALLSEPIPLVPGRSCHVAGEDITIVEAEPTNLRRTLTLRSVGTNLRWRLLPSTQLVLRNRRTKEAVLPVTDVDRRPGFGVFAANMDLTILRVAIPSQRSAVVDSRWLADAELLLAAIETVGYFDTRLALDDFSLPFTYYER